MSVVSIFSGTFCKEKPIIHGLLGKTEKKLVSDQNIVAHASELSGIAADKITRVFSAKSSVFNKFTHEKERSIAYLKLATAEKLSAGNLLVVGFVSHLIPKVISHVLRTCFIADLKFRTSVAVEELGLSEKEAIKLIYRQDEDRATWVKTLLNTGFPWDASLYDIVVPTDKMSVESATTLIDENLAKGVVKPTADSKQAVEDFLLAAKTEVALTKEGHNVGVSVKGGSVNLTINKHVLMLNRLEKELESIVLNVRGINSVKIRVGEDFYQTDIYRKVDLKTPSKVLLVDDEREFVQALSERLVIRDMGPTVAYDGESALNMIKEDEPEVMILDLKMPGIDGIEVLRRVKETNPEIEVIILTGHGSEADRKVCMELGAFAYIQKPVDIDVLSESIKKAEEKMRGKREV